MNNVMQPTSMHAAANDAVIDTGIDLGAAAIYDPVTAGEVEYGIDPGSGASPFR